jgi:hypothetical protein
MDWRIYAHMDGLAGGWMRGKECAHGRKVGLVGRSGERIDGYMDEQTD